LRRGPRSAPERVAPLVRLTVGRDALGRAGRTRSECRRRCGEVLVRLAEFGFALLRGAPVESGTVLRAVELFGFVRETNYGRLFDVRAVVEPTNLAFTSLPLGPHTDNPYRDPVPTLQLLHCLASNASGGDTTLVDGFAAAEARRRQDPDAFALLSRHPISFRYRDVETDLEARTPVIRLDAEGTVTGSGSTTAQKGRSASQRRSSAPITAPTGPSRACSSTRSSSLS
jgi:hypothetical protein